MTDSTRRPALILALTDDETERYSDWTECAAFRIVDLDDGTARLELTDNLERITAPETTDA